MAEAVGEIEQVLRSALALGGARYSFTLKGPEERNSLNDSLQRQGQLTPLLVVEDEGVLTVAAGSGRLAALTFGGVENIWVRRFLGSRIELWDRLLEEQLTGGPLNTGEVALYIKKRLADTGEDVKEFPLELLERLGLPPRHSALDDPLWIGSLEPPELFRYALGELPAKITRILMKAKRDDALAILRATRGMRLGANKIAEVVKCALECAWRDGISVSELLDSEELRAFEGDGEGFRAALRKLRYPTVTSWDEHFSEDVRALKLPDGVTVSHSPGFEGGRLRLTFAFSSFEGLGGDIGEVSEMLSTGAFAGLEKYLG